MAGGNGPSQKKKIKCRGHHYLEPVDSEAVKHDVKTELNFLLINGTVRRIKQHEER